MAYALSLIFVAFGYMCGWSITIAGFLLFMYLIYVYMEVFPNLGDGYYENYFPSLIFLVIWAFIMYYISEAYSYCGCWRE